MQALLDEGGDRLKVGTADFEREVSGVAPHANLISYKVCAPGCPSSATVAAVDQAITDNVDVLNYSISGSDDPWLDPVDLAFLDAHDAGISVSASAGNSGPGASTVAKTGPWNLSVAATTHSTLATTGTQRRRRAVARRVISQPTMPSSPITPSPTASAVISACTHSSGQSG